jgi:hypothetical protein
MGRVLRRIQEEDLTTVVVVPKWPSQWWWSVFREQQEKTVELGQSEQELHGWFGGMSKDTIKGRLHGWKLWEEFCTGRGILVAGTQ